MHKEIRKSIKERIEILVKEASGVAAEASEEKREAFGHYTTSVALKLAKEKGGNPKEIAADLAKKIQESSEIFDKVEVAGPGFINMWLRDEAIRAELRDISESENYGEADSGKGKKVIVEYSQPNIAKQMHTGHLRNTILGEALSRIHEKNGYEVVRWNWVGDWGTQFGRLIAAYKMWGKGIDLKEKPIEALEALYVRFHEAIKADPALEDRGREEFKKLEEDDKENRKLWELFRDVSLKEINEIYEMLNVRFDTYIGEAHFQKEMQPLVKELLEKNIAEVSEGAVIVNLEKLGLPPAVIQKSDGASLYLTRDIAGLRYRAKEYKPDKFLYVVGNEQALHFSQLIAIAGLLGIAAGIEIHHVKCGLLLGADRKKMSTRKGTSVSIRGLIDEAVERAEKIATEKNGDISKKELKRVSEAVGIGALKYFLLRENKMSDIVFDWEKMLDFRGDSGPYMQYTYARLRKLVAKSGGIGEADLAELKSEHELRLARKLFSLPDEVKQSSENITTNNITTYLFELANLANRFYEDEFILLDENEGRKNARLLLADTAARTIKNGLEVLGIEVLEAI